MWLITMLAGCFDPAPRQLCVVRHAEAFKNLQPPPAGMTAELADSLTPRGREQARAAGSSLPAGITAVFTSPAGRARETAQGLAVEPAAEVAAALRPLDGTVSWDDRLAHWAGGADPRPAGGESLADGWARARALRDEVARAPGGHVVFVTHGDVAALLLGDADGVPLLERPATINLANGEARCVPLPR